VGGDHEHAYETGIGRRDAAAMPIRYQAGLRPLLDLSFERVVPHNDVMTGFRHWEYDARIHIRGVFVAQSKFHLVQGLALGYASHT
jgi:hypothetical protein